MRIAFVTHQFFPAYYTGVERATLNVARQLGRMGHDCVVVTPAEHSSGDDRAFGFEGVHVRPVAGAAEQRVEPWRTDTRLLDRIGRVLDEERVELVDVMHPARLPEAFAAARRRELPVVAHVPDFGYVCPRQNLLRPDGTRCAGPERGRACAGVCRVATGDVFYAWGAAALDAAAAVVCPSRATTLLHAQQGVRVDHWVHVPWGVDYALHPRRLPAPQRGGLVIGFLGTLLRHKGAHVLVEALRSLPGRRIRLVLHGDSFHERRYEEELRRRAAGDARIELAGPYDQRDLAALLEPLDAVAIPSAWHENVPLTGLNAIAAGVPLLVSDVPGLRELADEHDCGFTFAPGDPSSLAALLDRLLADPGLLQDLRSRIRAPASLEEEAWRLETIYERALAGGARRRRRAIPSRTPTVVTERGGRRARSAHDRQP